MRTLPLHINEAVLTGAHILITFYALAQIMKTIHTLVTACLLYNRVFGGLNYMGELT